MSVAGRSITSFAEMRKELQAELLCHRYSLPTLSIEKENETMTDYPNNISAKLEIIKASEITPRIQYFPVDSIQT